MTPRLACSIGIAIIAASVTARGAALDTDAIDRLVERSMARWEVPAVAVAAVDQGRVVLFRVHGLGDVERGLAVTPWTLFAVGSIAKSLTVVALAQIADNGGLDWDAPASRYLPELRLRRLGNTRPVSVRDLVTHRSGMHRHDALWYLHAYTRAGLVRRLRHLDPFAPPGEVFQYSNLMVAAAGQLAARVSRRPWETIIGESILVPARMSDTRLSLARFLAVRDRAAGYFPGDKGRIRIPPRDTTAIAPAAAVYSNLHDMTRWLRILLAGGTIDGRRVVSASSIAEILTPRITVPDDGRFAELGPNAYGMGLYLTSYRGRRLARHPGVIDGYAALMSFMPEQDLGIVVLTNRSGSNLVPAILSYAIYDRLLGLEPIPWIDRFPSAERVRARRKFLDRDQASAGRTPMSLALQSYTGIYRHPAYGSIKITTDGANALTGRIHDIAFPLRHVGGNVWEVAEVRWPLRKGLRVRFHIGPSDRIKALTTPLADGPTYRHNPGDLTFARLPTDRPGPKSTADSINRMGSKDAERHR